LVKSLAFVLPTNLGLAMILIYAVIFLPFSATNQLLLPIGPTQLLWINLVAAVALALPLAFEAKEPQLMERPPRHPKEPILSPLVLRRTVMASLLMTSGAIGLFYWEFLMRPVAEREPLAEAQTMAVTTVIMFQVFYMLTSRSLRGSIRSIGWLSNPYVFIGIAVTLVLQALFIYAPPMQRLFGTAPLEVSELAMAVADGAIVLPVIAVDKWLSRRHVKRDASRAAASDPTPGG
jgi:Ca2+-transporting ATPase